MNLQLIKQDKFNDILVDVYRNDNDEVFMTAEQLGNVLEYSHPRQSINKIARRNPMLHEERFSVVTDLEASDEKVYSTRLFNKHGIKAIVQLSKKPNKIKTPILEYLGYSVFYDIERNEHKHLGTIVDAFRIRNTKREYPIGEYRTDLTFIDEKIVVECDEYGHKDYCPFAEKERELYLESQGYTIIRFNPSVKHFSIGLVIADIMDAIKIKEEL